MSQASLQKTAPTQFQDVGESPYRLSSLREGGRIASGLPSAFHRHDGQLGPHPYQPTGTRLPRGSRGLQWRSGGETPESMPAIARDVIAFIRTLGAKPVDLFGFSIGGMVAQQIALGAPDLVRWLILVGTGPAGREGMAAFSPQVQESHSRVAPARQSRRLHAEGKTTQPSTITVWSD